MKKQLLFSLFIIPLLLGSTPLLSNDSWKQKVDAVVLQPALQGEVVEFLVNFKEQADLSKAALFRTKEDKGNYVHRQLQQFSRQSQQRAVAILESQAATYRSYWIVNTLRAEGDLQLIRALAGLPEVSGIHPNPEIRFDEPDYRAETSNHGPAAIEWGITTTGADQVWAMGYTGQNVVIGGQDTGVEWDHPAIKDQYRGWNGSTATHDYNWWDAIHTAPGNPCGTDSPVPCDDHSHGTHTVGTMAGDDGGSNQIGMAPGARWIACRNMDEGAGTPTTYIECFQWFLAPTDIAGNNPDPAKAPHVINNSWSCPSSEGCNPGNFAAMETAVNNLVTAGVVVVVSAGNSGSNCSTVSTPAAIFGNSFTVGATNSSDVIAGFSSRGPVTVDGSNRMKPDLSAPGVSVRSCTPNNNYATWSGTSMAGPHVAGAVALLISADPAIAGNVPLIESLLTGSTLTRTTTQNCGGTSGSNSPNNTYGYGRMDALGAVNALMALPVELTDLRAVARQKSIALYWQTAAEYQNDHFLIERSTDLSNWTSIGKVNAAAINNGPADYSFEDLHPLNGINYYRLRQVDLDGTFEHSKVVTAEIETSDKRFTIYPNPVAGELSVRLDAEYSTPTLLRVFGATGRLVGQHQIPAGTPGWTVPSEAWNSGIYFIILTDEKGMVLGREKVLKL